jgi:hypothetical protein
MEAIAAQEEDQSPRWDAGGMRASLSAVRAAQDEARARNRRETLKARLLVVTAVVTFAVGLVATRTRAARKVASGPPAAAATIAPAAARPAAPLAAPSPATPTAESSARAALAAPPEAPPLAPAEPAAAGDAAASAGAIAECELLCKRHRWRDAAVPCAAAVKARPFDASLVLGLAQSEHAQNHLAEAGAWAGRAIALDSTLAEAFVIRAHAEARVGNRGAAGEDFRRYLALAPRGWHAREARAALRRDADREP